MTGFEPLLQPVKAVLLNSGALVHLTAFWKEPLFEVFNDHQMFFHSYTIVNSVIYLSFFSVLFTVQGRFGLTYINCRKIHPCTALCDRSERRVGAQWSGSNWPKPAKFWLGSACNDRKRKPCESVEPCSMKFVKSHQVNLISAGFIHLKPQCGGGAHVGLLKRSCKVPKATMALLVVLLLRTATY